MNLREIFVAALQLPTPAQQAAYLDSACENDPALRAQVDALLAEHAALGSFLQSPAAGEAETLSAIPESNAGESIGSQIGPYKVLQVLGQGGMGVVYLAEQTHPVQRRVALKVIKPELDSQQVISRFEAERQALAIMDHPHIAKVLDAGTTAAGRPYFAMEWVQGVPLTSYCDQQRLTTRERLELFLPICEAVQHAHQKGIIHRDLKPSNILIANVDGRPVPKVIDFGVAKAIQQRLTERTMFTQQGQILGTLEYMSPEQTRFDQQDIDTRSDIYSLGVVLYELLTGLLPFDRAKLRSGAFDELLRIIREDEPPRPSTRLKSAETLPSISANRRVEPQRLSFALRGELDWIVMKAIEKDRSRRYDSASELAADLQRYLLDQPVVACPPSAIYRLRKFARRHRVALAAVSVVLIALVAGTIVSTWQALRARRAEQLAEHRYATARAAVDTFLNAMTDDEQLRSAPLHSLRQRLLTSALSYYEQLLRERQASDQDLQVRADAWLRMGRLQSELGDDAAALGSFEKSLAGFQQLVRQSPAEFEYRRGLAGSHENRAWALRRLGRSADAHEAIQATLAAWSAWPADRSNSERVERERARALTSLGNLLRDQGDQDAARKAYDESRGLSESLLADHPDDLFLQNLQGQARHNLGLVANRLGDRAEARRHLDAALAQFDRLVQTSPTSTAYREAQAETQRNRGNVLAQLGEHSMAQAAYQAALDAHRELAQRFPALPEYRLALAASNNDLGHYLQGLDRFDEAIERLRSAVREFESLGDNLQARIGLARALHNLAWTQRRQKRYADARENFQRAIELRTRLASEAGSLPARRSELAQSWNDLGVTLGDQRESEAARRAYDRAIELQRELIESSSAPADRVTLAGTLCNVGNLEANQLPPGDVLPRFDQAIELLNGVLAEVDVDPTASRYLRNACWSRAEILEKLGRYQDAVKDWQRALELTAKGQRQPFLRSLALAQAQAGRHADAIVLADQMLAATEAKPVDAVTAAIVHGLLAGNPELSAEARERSAGRALQLLEQARVGGLFDSAASIEQLRRHPGLSSIRERPEFQRLLERSAK